MKKISLILFAAAILIPLASCSKDNDVISSGNSLTGTWELTRMEVPVLSSL